MKGLLSALGCRRMGKAPKWMPWKQKYILTHPLIYLTKRGIMVHVPTGFVTNFATWIRPKGLYEIPAVIHDYLYSPAGQEKYGMTRHEADKVFREGMRRAGCTQARINMMYYGVRLFGWMSYNK